MSEQLNKIMKQIASPKIKCVSFDMFDTLVQRPVMRPEDVFVLVGNILKESSFFGNRRIEAQNRALLLKDYFSAYITLDDIYKQYGEMFGTENFELDKIKQTELDVEYNLIFSRESIKKIFYFALEKGKKVIITTDMYLSSDFLSKVLIKNGYEGWYKLYVSCEENATKRSGELYNKILDDLEEIGIYADNVLHIGDNQKSDVEMPISRGISAINVPSAISCFNRCKKLKNIENWNSVVYPGTQNLLIGLYACLIFDDPFVEFDNSTLFNGEGNNLGEYLAPFIVSYCLWMVHQTKKDKIDFLGLVWRDGYIPREVINILYNDTKDELPKMQKVYLNRALRYGYVANKKGGLFDSCYQWALNPEMNIREFAHKMMNCQNEDEMQEVFEIFANHGYVSAYEKIGKVDRYIWFIHELEPMFQKNHLNSNRLLKKHVQNMSQCNNLGIFDIGYRATVSRFLKEFFSIESTTYQMFGTTGSDDEIDGVHINSYVKYGQNIVRNTKNSLHKFMELIISEQMPSIIKLEIEDEKVVPVCDMFFKEDQNVYEIQKGILRYTIKFSQLFSKYYDSLNSDRNVLFTMITSVLSSPAQKDALCIKNLRVTGTHYAEIQEDFSRWYNSFFGEEK